MFWFWSKQFSVKYQTNDLFVNKKQTKKNQSDILNKKPVKLTHCSNFFSKILQPISKKSQSVNNSVKKKKTIKSFEKINYVSA